MDQCNIEGDDIYDLLNLADIRENDDILSLIKLDITPRMMMEPRYQSDPGDLKKLQEVSGYMFYIESECTPPSLMLLKIGKTDITTTIGRIEEVPAELVKAAIESPVHPPEHGMYAINDAIKDWLKKKLGI